MILFYDKLQQSYLGYMGLYVCISVGFLCLHAIGKKEIGPTYWAASFLFNSLGFLFWSETILDSPKLSYLLGEVFHITGFLLLIAGAYKFTGKKYGIWASLAVVVWITAWAVSILLFKNHQSLAGSLLKSLRAVLFIFAGIIIMIDKKLENKTGRNVAGISLLAWGIYIIVFGFININPFIFNGFLVGFHVLSAFGMVVMIIGKISAKVEESELKIKTLEGILPICAYCKKIRDEEDHWHHVESYIENRSKAEFTHGICPDCFAKHKPD